MKELFAGILNISISAGILIVVCVLVRLAFKNMPKFVRCLMWLLVAIRLAIPFNIESSLSLLPTKDYVTVSSVEEDEYYVEESTAKINETAQAPTQSQLQYSEGTGSVHEVELGDATGVAAATNSVDVMYILSIVWLVGVAAVLVYAVVAYIRLKNLVAEAVRLNDNVFQSERVGTAFVLGVISPKIYVPSGLGPNELYMSLCHERAHIARRDHLVKPLGFIIAAVYWFNPLVWLAYLLLCRDIELACDEKVIKKIGYDKKKDYSQALLNLSIPRKYIAACPVAFGEVGINERVKNVLKMKKGKKIIIAVAIALCAVLGICFLTYPRTKDKTEKAKDVQASEEVTTESVVTEESTSVSDEPATEAEEATATEASNKKGYIYSVVFNGNKDIQIKSSDGSDFYLCESCEDVFFGTSEEDPELASIKFTDNGHEYEIAFDKDFEEGLENGSYTLYLDTTNKDDPNAYLEGSDGKTLTDVVVSSIVEGEPGNKVTVYAIKSETSDGETSVNLVSGDYIQEGYVPDENGDMVKVVKMSTGEAATKEVWWPLDGGGSVTSITSSKHNGTDIACKEGTGVISVFDGTVDEVGYDDDKGNYIVIVDKDGWTALYSHLQEAPTLAKGDSVKLKDVIGKAGNTGKSTGPHLHFELTNPEGNVEPPILICGDE